MDGTSLNISDEKIKELKQILPEVFTEDKIDWEKLKATLGEDINFANERYVLNWAGKSDAFKTLQTPTSKTLIPAKDESINFDETENIFIEGENLEVLKVLQKSYFGKVKMIYIDPPYNTGNDSFIYPDKFSETKREYQERVGDKDEEGYMTKSTQKFPSLGGVAESRGGTFPSFGGVPQAGWSKNSKENGQYHSNWLNMMMPRLYLAKNLLREDGLIFISIDFNELHNLKLLCNEIFGEENFRNQVIIRRGAKSVQAQFDTWDKLGVGFEYVLIYSKNSDFRFPKMMRKLEELKAGSWNNHWRGTDRPTMRYELFNITPDEGQWRWGKERSFEAIRNYKRMLDELNETEDSITQEKIDDWYIKKNDEDIDLLRLSSTGKPEHYIAPTDTMLLNDVWFDIPPHSSRILKSIFGKNLFNNPKPLELIHRIMEFGQNNDTILDFFSGSGTTAHAVMDLNKEDGGKRKYICVQLPELTEEKSEAYKAGYKTIAEIAKERIRRAGKKIEIETKEEIKKIETKIKKLQGELPTEETKAEIENLKEKIEQLQSQDLGFKVLKLSDSNFKQWQQIEGKDVKALEEQMKFFVDPVAEHATTENMLYELLLKSGEDLNSNIFPSYGGVAESRGGTFPSFGGVSESRGGRNSQNYFNLPYNPNLKQRARELRKAGNLSEVLFWNQVKNKQFKGLDFDRQKIIGNYIVDFYCPNCNVVVEIDGDSHNDKVEYDAKRDAYLENLGLVVIHIPVAEIMNNMGEVMEMLYNHPALKGTPPKEGNLLPDYYLINDNKLVLLLEKVSQELISEIISKSPKKVIALDRLFKGNDQLKTNTVLQMRDAGVEFKTI